MKIAHRFTAILVIAVLPPGFAQAFNTHIHGEITREVLAPWGMNEEGVKLTVAGNENTDNDPVLYNTMHPHFCNEEFEKGSERLRSKFKEALESLARCDRAPALDAIGTSLHGIQDFYAHSNAINVYPDPNVTVDLFHLRDPGPDVVCSPGHLPSQLTSAYWPDDVKVPGKCVHAEIAKDEPGDGPGFHVARARAVLATARYFQAFEQAVGLSFADADAKMKFLKSGFDAQAPCRPSPLAKRADRILFEKLLALNKSSPAIVVPDMNGSGKRLPTNVRAHRDRPKAAKSSGAPCLGNSAR